MSTLPGPPCLYFPHPPDVSHLQASLCCAQSVLTSKLDGWKLPVLCIALSIGLTCRDPAMSPCLAANRHPACDIKKDMYGPSVSALALCCSAPDLAGPVYRPCLLNLWQALQDETSTGRKCVDSWCRRVRLPCLGIPWPSSAKNMGRPWCRHRREAYVL